MKALTNILTRLLMLLMIFIVACTEETAEVDNLSRGEQYVTVRMNIPGMTAAATRAADGVIETIHALAFDTNKKLLGVRTATNISNANENDGFNGTFNIIVPNGTTTIHFLANLPSDAISQLPPPTDIGGSEVDVMTSIKTTDYIHQLSYWGMADYDGTSNTLSTTLYRHKAMIAIEPSKEDDGFFNQYEASQLRLRGLYNTNESGTLVPYDFNNDNFNFNSANNSFITLPKKGLTSGNYELSDFETVYVFEHENTKSNPLCVIIKIDNRLFFKVAIVDEDGNPYPIIRNHKYTIYVSDVDDYIDTEYQASSYEDALTKDPINLEVEVVELEDVTISPTETQTIQLSNTFTVTMTVPEGGTLTDFSITAEGFTFDQPATSYSTGTYTFNFTPTSVGSKTITFTGTGSENLNDVNTTINVNVTSSITANADKQQLYYDSDDTQTVTVQVTVPAGVETLNIGGAENFTIAKTAGDGTLNETTYTMGSERTATFTFTLNAQNVTNQQVITFSGDNVTAESVTINMVQTPTVAFSPDETSKTMNVSDTYTVTMDPNGGTLTSLSIAAEGFTVTSSSGGLSGPTNNVYTYAGGSTTFTFTPSSAGSRTICFSGGQGVNINVPDKEIAVTVNAAITATATPSTIYYDGDDKTTTVSVTIPKGVSALNITATDFTVALQSGNGNLNGNTYTLNDTNGQIAVFVFTYTGAQSESTQTITFNDATNNDNVNGASVTILVKKAEIDVPVLVEGENILQLDKLPLTLGNNNGIVLLKANGNNESGLLESYRNYIAENVTLKITFTSDGEANPLSFQTTWSGELEEEYSSDSSMKYLSYTFKSTDFEKGNGGENTIANAGLKLQAASNSNSTITAISIIIPASTTE